MLRAFLMVGIGGFAGSVSRYGVSYLINKSVDHPFPFATFIINIVGCFIIGLLFGLGQRNQWLESQGWLLLATGFCGGFTTFSAFALENVKLIREQQSTIGLIYTISSVVIGILVCRMGIWLTR
ncbi:MAG: fluoride efflux transporter CrcB [Bacteroidota bacterium]